MRRSPWSAIAKAVVRFLESLLMGCFLSCFRARPDPPSHREPLVPENRLGELFLDVEKEFEGSGGLRGDADGGDGGVAEELQREAKYLKSCGAILETPAEIREASHLLSVENTTEHDHNSSIVPGMEEASICEEKSSACFTCDKHDMSSHKLNFEGTEHHLQGDESVPQSVSQYKSPFQSIESQLLDSSDSPYPTPLVLAADMQTPGTVYTAQKRASRTGKRTRTRTQFIYPVLRPIENKFQLMEPREESPPMLLADAPKKRNLGSDSSKNTQMTSPISVAKKGESSESGSFSFPTDNAHKGQQVFSLEKFKNETSCVQVSDSTELSNSDNGEHAVLSLSRWLEPSPAVGGQGNVKCTVGEQLSNDSSVLADRPIFGAAAAAAVNWDGDNPTPLFPKLWDGNGIPNTTTKYKEDQKVSWHATPFEERLEKVLSDDKIHPPRKLVGEKLFVLEEKKTD